MWDWGITLSISGIIATLIIAALTMSQQTSREFRLTKIFFWLAAIIFWGAILIAQWSDTQPLSISRLLINGALAAIAAILLTVALDWTKGRESQARRNDKLVQQAGGKGGDAIATEGGRAFGGPGGESGVGIGGDGGSAEAHGNGSIAAGGEGGGGPRANGTGGVGGRSGAEIYYEKMGIPLPSDLRGWGHGGDGGGLTESAKAGQSGLIRIEYAPQPVHYPPKNLYDLFQREAYSAGKISIEQLELRSAARTKAKLELGLSWGTGCAPKTLWIFVHEGKNTLEALRWLLPQIHPRAQNLDIQLRTGATSPCEPIGQPDGFVPFTGTIYAFHDSITSPQEAKYLIRDYSKYGLNLILKDPAYLKNMQENWNTEITGRLAKQPTHVIYFPGNP